MRTPLELEEPAVASVHVYDWGNALAAHAFVQLGMGLPPTDSRELAHVKLPLSLLCDVPQAAAMAALITELGGSVAVTLERGPTIRLLAHLGER